MPDLTKNFALAEFLVSDTALARGIVNLPTTGELANIRKVAERLQALRDFLNAALRGTVSIKITSGFRCEALNKAVGGAPSSDHRTGLAADFKALYADGSAVSPRVLMRTVEALGGFDQAIYYPGETRIHVGYGEALRGQMLTKAAGGYQPYETGH